ncbi:MAG: hypothetical protein RL701_3904, partial [Pseudomonadota bacterium]
MSRAGQRKRNAALLARIEAEATAFDLRALLRLLAAHGYERHDLVFHSNPDDVSSGALIHSVQFAPAPARTVDITLNMGLLGSNGLLPSYFAQLIERAKDPQPYYDFVHFFDHLLLSRYVCSVFPEDDSSLFESYPRVKQQYVRMLGLGSVSTLHWLFVLYFPELQVRVSRRPFAQATDAHAFQTGVSLLDGTGILGRRYESVDEGFCVELFAEEETNDNGSAWPHLVRERFRSQMLPLLRGVNIPLTLVLSVLSHATWVHIQREGYLGYERFRTTEESGHRIVVESLYTGYASPVFLRRKFLGERRYSELEDIRSNLEAVLRSKRGSSYFLETFGMTETGYRTPEEMIAGLTREIE